MDKKRIIHVVGLQKSGTSLLVRLLENSGHAQFLDGSGRTEGGIDWGNRPSFSPTAWPAGTIYQRSNGDNGHEIEAKEATADVCESIRGQLAAKSDAISTRFGISKIPYDMVRLPWVRGILPDLFIVGIIRRPVPNAFSLWKQFQPSSGTNPPEEGWWGVKPRGWRSLVSVDKVVQVAMQWDRTNLKMWEDRECLDRVVTYDELCARPAEIVTSILCDAAGGPVNCTFRHDALPSCDQEYVSGGRVLPRRRDWITSNDLVLQELEIRDVDPFSAHQIQVVEQVCNDTAQSLGVECR
jgi:hypothetical protein